MKKILLITIAIAQFMTCLSQDISGKWSGAIKGQKEQTVFIFQIEKHGQGYTTVIDIPTNRLVGLKPKETTFANGELLVDASNLGFKYQGKFIQNSLQIDGFFEEGVNKLPLNLSKEAVMPEKTYNRPQEPIRPFPYKEEEVMFENKGAGVTLAGTLTLPLGNGPFSVAILISGSGPQDRDETFSTHKTFLVLSDYLTRQGLAVLRYDDRGVGKSTGDHSQATTKDFASDVVSAVEYLKSRTDINRNKIGLIGHSEGGIIAPMVANQSKNVSFIVLLAGTGIPGSEISLIQAKAMRGFPVPDEAAYEQAIRKAITIASADKEVAEIKKELSIHYKNTIVPIIKPLLGSDEKVNEAINRLVEARTTTWVRYFYTYNPANELERVTCPVLSLNGSRDTQVSAKINQDGIRNALIKGGNKDYLIKELPDLNHLFQECKTGSMREYSEIEQTFAPSALQTLSDWILKHMK
jgi:uncharacterized protein